MVFEYRRQPLKGLYVLYQALSITFIRLPFIVLTSVPRGLRPSPSWTFKQAVIIGIGKCLSPMGPIFSKIGLRSNGPSHRAIPESKDIKSVWVEPISETHIMSTITAFAAAADVHPIRIPGYYIDAPGSDIPIGSPPTTASEKIVYGLHGGGYILGSANPGDMSSNIYRGLLGHFSEAGVELKRTFAIEYRLSVGTPLEPQNPFPAALLDALAGYEYLINVVGFDPANIVLVGDSAGGNLALALTRYLVEAQADSASNAKISAPPGSLLLLAPRCDLSNSHYTPSSTALLHTCDVLPDLRVGIADYARNAYLGPHGIPAAESSVYLSPAALTPALKDISFEGFPRTFISSGGAERLLDQMRMLRSRMARDLGDENVTYYEAPDAIHDFLAMPFWEPARGETLRRIGEWLKADKT